MNTVLENQDVTKKPKRKFYFWVKRLKKPFKLGGYGLLVFGMGFAIWFSMTRTATFALKKIEVVGDFRSLNMEEILKRADVSLGTNLFKVPLKEVERNILELKWVHSVLIRRQVPNLLWIHVKEQKPKAILFADKLYFVSEEAKVFKEVEKESRRDLPVLTGFEKQDSLQEALALIDFFESKHDFSLFGLSEIHYNGATGFSIVTLKGPIEVQLGKENLEGKLSRLKTIWSELAPKWSRIRGVDLNYEDRAFVKL